MKKSLLIAALLCAGPAFAQNQTQMVCRDLKDSGGFLYAGETVVNGQACRQVTYAPVQKATLVNTSASSADPRPVATTAPPAQPAGLPAPVVATSETSVAPADAQAVPTAAPKECLIVTSAEGHRFRNSMIAGVLTGGIGLAAGAAFSGGRYEYRDSYGVPASEIKVKYKGPELQGLEQKGVHVIVVDKKDKTGEEVKDARAACTESVAK